MSEQAWYKDWFNSPFYHKLYRERDENEAAAFIDRIMDYLQPVAKSSMLDVACGRGRHSRILAGKGFNVTGIDLSPENIEFAKKCQQDNLEFYLHDMRMPFRVNYYDHAFNFFTSFGYFKTRREHDDAIRTISQSLKPGGSFMIDYLNVHYTESHFVPNETKNIDGTNYEIHRWEDDHNFYKKIIISDPLVLHTMDYTEKVAKFSFGDFNDMLSYHSMQVQDVFGDYMLNPYDTRKTKRMIIFASKKS